MTATPLRPAPDPADPKGLVRESYAIAGITAEECRSIFLDWALSLPEGADPVPPLRDLLGRYGTEAPDHPMTRVMEDGLAHPAVPGRRGGRAARVPQDPPVTG